MSSQRPRGTAKRFSKEKVMPLYYIDVYNGETYIPDTQGQMLGNPEEARSAALTLLPEVARQVPPNGNQRVMMTHVKDADGRPLFRAILSLTGEWLI
jgi:hypothetical protein